MFDYTYFNYNTSLSENAKQYYHNGGFYLDSHSFSKNKNYSCSFEELMNVIQNHWYHGITEMEIDLWEKYFSEVYEVFHFEAFEQIKTTEQNKIVTEE